MERIKAVCERCRNKEHCQSPCWFVQYAISKETDGSLERQTGDNELTHYGNREKRFSDFSDLVLRRTIFEVADNTLDPKKTGQRYDEMDYTPEQKTADIFFHRFFLGWSYADIGAKFGMSRREAAGRYGAAKKRLLEILKILDGKSQAIQAIGKTKKSLTKDQKAFILHKVFGFPINEISVLPGYGGPDWLRKKINAMYDDLKVYFPGGVPDPDTVLAKSVKAANGGRFTKGVSHADALQGVR